MFGESALLTNALWVKLRFCFVLFFVKIWLLKACLRLILPDAVSLKRFLALDLVFIFGMALDFRGLFFLRIEHDGHALAFQFGHLFYDTYIFKLGRKA